MSHDVRVRSRAQSPASASPSGTSISTVSPATGRASTFGRAGWHYGLLRLRAWLLAFALLVVGWPAFAASDVRRPADTPQLGDDLGELAPLPRGFDTFDAGWLHLAYPPSLSHWVEPLIQQAHSFRTEASLRLGQPVLSKVRVRLAEDPTQMASLAPTGAPYPKYAVGVAYSKLELILLTQTPVHPNTDHDLLEVFRHELAHLALEEAVQGARVPLWFNEGLAVHLSRENAFARTQTLWTAVVSGNLIPLAEIERHFPDDIVGVPLAYAQSADVVRYLLRTEDQERFRSLIKRLRRGQAFEAAMSDAYGLDSFSLERVWQADAESRYTVWPVLMSGTLVWGGALVLVVLAWRRKRQRQEATLRRWAREEALDELRRLRIAQAAKEPFASPGPQPSAPPPPQPAVTPEQQGPLPNWGDANVPRVEHEGSWHILH